MLEKRAKCLRGSPEMASSATLAGFTPAQEPKMTFLGTGLPQPRMDRLGPSILVEAGNEKVLFDGG